MTLVEETFNLYGEELNLTIKQIDDHLFLATIVDEIKSPYDLYLFIVCERLENAWQFKLKNSNKEDYDFMIENSKSQRFWLNRKKQ